MELGWTVGKLGCRVCRKLDIIQKRFRREGSRDNSRAGTVETSQDTAQEDWRIESSRGNWGLEPVAVFPYQRQILNMSTTYIAQVLSLVVKM